MSSKNKIEELVYKGMVLDEHGGWVTIVEKLRKEREFLHHLEQGEILYNGLWTKMSAIPRITGHPEETKHIIIEGQSPFPDKKGRLPVGETTSLHSGTTQTPLETPEETVSYSIETLHDLSSNIVTIGLESDYPPETKIFSIMRPGQNVSPSPQDTANNTNNIPPSSEAEDENSPHKSAQRRISDLFKVPPETEFEETVLYNINVLRQTDKNKSDATTTGTQIPSRPLADSRLKNDFFTGHNDLKGKKIAVPLVTVIIALLLLALLIRILL